MYFQGCGTRNDINAATLPRSLLPTQARALSLTHSCTCALEGSLPVLTPLDYVFTNHGFTFSGVIHTYTHTHTHTHTHIHTHSLVSILSRTMAFLAAFFSQYPSSEGPTPPRDRERERARERERERERERARERDRARERECVSVCECVCVRERGRGRTAQKGLCVCVCVCVCV